jgi:hypothetical protein
VGAGAGHAAGGATGETTGGIGTGMYEGGDLTVEAQIGTTKKGTYLASKKRIGKCL